MPPRTTRQRTAVAAAEAARQASAPLPDLPDACWDRILIAVLTADYKSFYRLALVCRRFARLVQHCTALETSYFDWHEKDPSSRRAQLFVGDWLPARAGKPLSDLNLALLPPQGRFAVTQEFRAGLFCALGLLGPQLSALHLVTSACIVTHLGRWIGGFSQLQHLRLRTIGHGLAVWASLACLSRLTTLELECAMTAEGPEHAALNEAAELENAERAGVRLTFPPSHSWLPKSLRNLTLSCPTLSTLPSCLSGLTGQEGLFVSSCRTVDNPEVLQHINTGCRLLSVSGCVPPAAIALISSLTALEYLTLWR